MAQLVTLKKTLAKPGVKDSGFKYGAYTVNQGKTDLSTLCQLIAARSSISSADVRAVLDSLNFIVDFELKQGRIVQLDTFGSFRMTVGSDRVDDKKDFTTSMIRQPKIVFTPYAALRETRKTIKFSVKKEEGTEPEEGGETPEL